MSSNVIKDARSQVESIAIQVLEQLTANSAKTIEDQISEASKNMGKIRDQMLASFSGSLSTDAASSLQAFERSMDESAKQSVERWRLKLAGNLNGLAKNLGEPF
jgi:hypothetical protein